MKENNVHNNIDDDNVNGSNNNSNSNEEINWEEKYKELENNLKDRELDSTIKEDIRENNIDNISDEDYNLLKEIKGLGNDTLYKRFIELIGSSNRGFKFVIGANSPGSEYYSRGNSFANYIDSKKEI